jgi:tRNA U55 pseudouridine synthase TruB
MNTPPWSIKREMIIKDNEKTDQSFGYTPNTRPILEHLKYGIVNLDKPSGPTSHETVSWVKKILNIPKAGHAGTLEVKTGEIPLLLEYYLLLYRKQQRYHKRFSNQERSTLQLCVSTNMLT